jgi:6-phosphogluconate dehydrogenase (decarboxylating)
MFSRRHYTSDSVRVAKPIFANKLLSAMRYEFGGHLEKATTKGQAA